MAKKAELRAIISADLSPLIKGAAKAAAIAKSLAKQFAKSPIRTTALAGFLVAEKGAKAFAAGVGKLVLFHHDPMRTDDGVAEIEGKTRELFASSCAAREGMTIALDGREDDLAA